MKPLSNMTKQIEKLLSEQTELKHQENLQQVQKKLAYMVIYYLFIYLFKSG